MMTETAGRFTIVCTCGNVLARWLGPPEYRIVRMIRHGRELVGVPISITCESCGGVWSPPLPRHPLTGMETT